MLAQIAQKEQPSKEFKTFCNSLRCPLCESQLDGNINPKEARLYCVSNNDEYAGIWVPSQVYPINEDIRYWYPQYQYVITIDKGPNNFHTVINRYNLDVALIHRASTRKEVFNYIGSRILFFRKRMDEELFLKKLKTYQVFS
jgi:hypothetical protein